MIMKHPNSRSCDMTGTRYPQKCWEEAKFFVTYFTDGSGGVDACTQHLAKAVKHVVSQPTVNGRTVSVTQW